MTLFDSSTQVRHLHLKVWLSVFIYAMLAGLAVQLVILPHVFPQLHAGNGLLAGRDWVGFHEQAVVQSLKIAEFGWSEFRLRPDGENIIAGLCSALYYFITPKPWVLLPINSALFATAALTLFSLVKYLGISNLHAMFAIAAFVVFPSSIVQFGQIHKDIFCTSGLLLNLWCWVSLLQRDLQWRRMALIIFISILATGIVWLFRPYFMQILLYWVAAFFCWYLLLAMLMLLKNNSLFFFKMPVSQLVFPIRSAAVMLLLFFITHQYYSSYLDLRFHPSETVESTDNFNDYLNRQGAKIYSFLSARLAIIPRSSMQSPEAAQTSETGSENLNDFLANAAKNNRPVAVMKEGAYVENFVNRIYLRLAVARGGFTNSGKNATTNIDREVVFYSPGDLVRYIPRALQIGFFAPFPQNWFGSEGEKKKPNRFEVYIAGMEMLLSYIAFFGWAYWIAQARKVGVQIWIPTLFALSVILLMGLTVANVGTLYRMRFPFIMIFITFGVAGLLQFFNTESRPAKER